MESWMKELADMKSGGKPRWRLMLGAGLIEVKFDEGPRCLHEERLCYVTKTA